MWKLFVLTSLLLPPILAGGASGAFYLRLHRESRQEALRTLPLVTAPGPGHRILVLSPHCDDETLGVGGMIADARRSGSEVTLAFLTNGDGFPLAAGRALRDPHLSADDYIRFAEKRQEESVAALEELGVPESHVRFLGYPDRGLGALWEEHWDPSRPFRSPYTDRTRSPYAQSYTPRAAHCGASLLADLRRLMETTRPTDIYVTHPADDHPDHAAAAAFAQAALLLARDGGSDWAHRARLRYYLIHRGDWPLPQGLRPEAPLVPPVGMRALDTRWEAYPISKPAREAKMRALKRYRSQMAVMSRFLHSFVRTNELYGEMPGGFAGQDIAWAAPDATRDDVLRDIGPSADLSGLSVRCDADALRIRVRTRGRLSPRVRYTLLLRTLGADGKQARFLTLPLPVKESARDRADLQASGTTVIARDNVAEAIVPIRSLFVAGRRPTRVWVAAETRWSRLPVDRTGARPFTLEGPDVASIKE